MTRITLLAVSRRPPAWIQTGFQEYRKRLPREIRLETVEVQPARRAGGRPSGKPLLSEAEAILKRLPSGGRLIALDEKGGLQTTLQLSARLAEWMQSGVDPCFIVGGADGLHDSVKRAADETWSLSRYTLPHALVRVLLAEQVYRAWCILSGHPYHRE